MSYYSTYRWCAVPECKNTSVKTPNKLWIRVPTDINNRKAWFKAAGRNPELVRRKTRLYFCEDHFNLEHDMQNYVQFKIMGSTKRIILIPRCVPSRFDCRNEHESVSNESCLAEAKRLRISVCKDLVPDHIETDDVKALCIEESPAVPNVPLKNKSDKVVEVPEHMATPPVIGQKHMATPVVTSQKHMATPVVISQEHMATPVVISRISRKHEGIQDYPKAQYIIKPMKSDVKNKVEMTTPMKFIASTSTSPLKTSMINATKPSVSRLCFIEEKCDNDTLCTQSFVKSTVDQDYCLSKAEDIIARVYNYLQAEYEQLKSSIGGHCDLSPLANILARTAAATGVSELAVSAILEQRKRSAVEEQPLDNGPAKRANFTCEGGENVSPITDDESTWNASYEEQDDENEQMDDDSEEQDEFKLRMEIKIEDEDETDSAVEHVISSTSSSCPTSDTFVEKPVKIKIEPNTVDTELKPKAVRTILPHVQLRGSACEVTRVACDNVYTPLEIIPYRGLLFLAQNWTI